MTTVVPIKGDIVTNDYGWFYDLLGDDYASPKSVSSVINQANGDDLDIQINSGGGLVTAGVEIYTMLKSYTGTVNVNVVGVAYSAASLIAMAGDVVAMSPAAMMMIHNVSGGGAGDYHDMANISEELEKSNQAVANAYADKTGMSQDEILQLMDSTYWLDPQTAIDKGFADKMMFADADNKAPEPALAMTASLNQLPTKALMDKFRQFVTPEQSADTQMLNTQIRLLKMKGEITHE